MMIKVTRTQYPVGQGCFHAASIEWQEDTQTGPFHYIYDCGSQSSQVLIAAINAMSKEHPRIDALFVSHLDNDHVSGLQELLRCKRVPVDTVFVPHLSTAVVVANLVAAEKKGASSSSLVEASIDPESWFGQRGVSRVVRVAPAPSTDALDPEPEAEDPPDDGKPQYAKLIWAPREQTHGHVGSGTATSERMNSGEMVAPGLGAQYLDWVLVPHVDPVKDDRLAKFEKMVVRTLKLGHIEKLTYGRLLLALQDSEKNGERRKLRSCYLNCFGKSHNRVSMSLYSGPRNTCGTFRKYLCAADRFSNYNHVKWKLAGHVDPIAWIGTGDSDLNVNKVRKAWQRSFSSFLSNVSTLLLPHHGSFRNFHPELTNIPNLTYCVVAARTGSKHHPGKETVNAVRSRKKKIHHVSDKFGTLLCERIAAG